MKQKDIYLAGLNPTIGAEQRGLRPVVIISGDSMNQHFDVCIVCPISSRIKGFAGCLFLQKDNMNNLTHDSEVITFQVRTIDKTRLTRRIGEITDQQLLVIKKGLNEILTY